MFLRERLDVGIQQISADKSEQQSGLAAMEKDCVVVVVAVESFFFLFISWREKERRR